MAQSTCEEVIPDASLVHVAIILDGGIVHALVTGTDKNEV